MHITRRTPRAIPLLAALALLLAGPALQAQDAPPPSTAPAPAAEPVPHIIIPRDLGPSPSPAADPSPHAPHSAGAAAPPTAIPANDLQFWNLHWKSIAMLFAHVGDRTYAAPNFDPRFPSSMHTTADRYIADHTTEERASGGGVVRSITHQPSRPEAVAAASHLPDFTAGSYGYIHAAKVVQILGPTEMIVSEIQLIDPQELTQAKETLARAKQIASAELQQQQRAQQEELRRRQNSGFRETTTTTTTSTSSTRDVEREFKLNFEVRQKIAEQQERQKNVQLRVVGYSTASLAAGATWRIPGTTQGAQLVLVADEPQATGTPSTGPRPRTSSSSSRAPVLALSAELFERAPTEAQFDQVLAEANLTRPAFCQLARDIMRSNKGDDRPVIVLAIETARKKAKADAKPDPAKPPTTDPTSKSGSGAAKK